MISRKSGGTWKFRATREGRILYTKRAELDSIRSHFRIDCDQPLTVLTQDAARNFLQQSDPHQLYKVRFHTIFTFGLHTGHRTVLTSQFFLTGTNLRSLYDTYKKATENIEMAQINAASQSASLDALRDQARTLNEDVQKHERLEDQRKHLDLLKTRCQWAKVRDKETVSVISWN